MSILLSAGQTGRLQQSSNSLNNDLRTLNVDAASIQNWVGTGQIDSTKIGRFRGSHQLRVRAADPPHSEAKVDNARTSSPPGG
jgi:hypothetical protein